MGLSQKSYTELYDAEKMCFLAVSPIPSKFSGAIFNEACKVRFISNDIQKWHFISIFISGIKRVLKVS